MAPNLKGLFTKPREMMAVKLVSIVGLVVSVSASPTTMADVMRDVGVRHVVYGVAPHHLPVRRPRRQRSITREQRKLLFKLAPLPPPPCARQRQQLAISASAVPAAPALRPGRHQHTAPTPAHNQTSIPFPPLHPKMSRRWCNYGSLAACLAPNPRRHRSITRGRHRFYSAAEVLESA